MQQSHQVVGPEPVELGEVTPARVMSLVDHDQVERFRCEDLRWSLVTGIFEDTLHLSLRATGKNAHAGRVARKSVGVMGSAGGHGHMAGGQIQLGELDKTGRRRIMSSVTNLFLDAVKAKKSLMNPLTGDTLPDETDTDISIG